MSKKISNNPSYEKLRTEMEQFSDLGKLLQPFIPELKSDFDKAELMKEQLETLAKMPDDFNELYANRGWIACESMSSEAMESAIACARKSGVDEGEKILMAYYNPENVRSRFGFIRGIREFATRMELIQLALEDYCNGRFHACIPVLLMMADGIVMDVNKHIGVFAENVDMSAWDSIAAHESGLGQLARLFGRGRNKTTTEPITIPYRNGILHGRDISYNNAAVAAKTWAFLFAVRDWAVAVRKAPQTSTDKPLELTEVLETWERVQKKNQLMDEWAPRRIQPGVDIPIAGSEHDYAPNSPEQMVIRMLTLWKNGNYGKMAEMIYLPGNINQTIKVLAGELRDAFDGKKLINFKLCAIKDEAPAITEVTCEVYLLVSEKTIAEQITVRCIYMESEERPVGKPGNGGWTFIDKFKSVIYLLKP